MATDDQILAIAGPEIELEEGCELAAYWDKIGKVWTIGYGATGAGIASGVTWTIAHAKADLAARLPALLKDLDARIGWWRSLDAPRAAVLVSMAYNMGAHELTQGWPHFMAACRAGDWAAAKYAMLNPPTWLNEVKTRATTLADQMLTGVVA